MGYRVEVITVGDWEDAREGVILSLRKKGISQSLPFLLVSDDKNDIKAYKALTNGLTQQEKGWVNIATPTQLALSRSKTLPAASTVVVEVTEHSSLLQSLGGDPLNISGFLCPLCRHDVNIYVLHGA